VIETWDAWISRLEGDRSLLEPERLRQRMDVLDPLETHPAWGAAQGGDADPAWPVELVGRLSSLRAALEAANQRVYASTRDAVQRGTGAQSLLEWAAAGSPADDIAGRPAA